MFFPAQLQRLGGMLAYIRDAAAQVGFTNSEMQKIELASEEALVNIISYAYPKEVEGDIEIICSSPEPSCLKIVFKDKGLTFNPLEHKSDVNVEASLDERRVGGLGLFFICQMMDDVSYQRENDTNMLSLIKRHQ